MARKKSGPLDFDSLFQRDATSPAAVGGVGDPRRSDGHEAIGVAVVDLTETDDDPREAVVDVGDAVANVDGGSHGTLLGSVDNIAPLSGGASFFFLSLLLNVQQHRVPDGTARQVVHPPQGEDLRPGGLLGGQLPKAIPLAHDGACKGLVGPAQPGANLGQSHHPLVDLDLAHAFSPCLQVI